MSLLPRALRSLHYRWVIAFTGVPVLLSAIGLGRLAFGVQLPGMQSGLHLSAAQMGSIGTCNFAGYLGAMLFSPFLVRRFGPRAITTLGLIVVGLSLITMSRASGFLGLAVSFTITGIGTGLANLAIMALLPHWFAGNERGKATGIVLWGNSVGIVLAGLLIPAFNRAFGVDGWRVGWLTLGLIGLAAALIAGVLLRDDPREKGLPPVAARPVHLSAQTHKKNDRGALIRLSLIYAAFGVTTSVYSAFIVFSMIHEYGLSGPTAGFYWSWMGLCSFFSGVGFGSLSDRIGRRYGLAVVFAVYTASYALAGLKLGPVAMLVSIVLYGLSIFGSVAIVTAAVGDYFESSSVAHALSFATMVFAIGQTLGPIAAGALASASGQFTHAYLIAAGVTAAAALFALTLPGRPKAGH